MNAQRTVISGIGAITPDAQDRAALLERLMAPPTGSGRANEIPGFLEKAEKHIPYNTLRRIAKYSALALYTHVLACEDAGLAVTEENQERIGSIMNTVYGPLKVTEGFLSTLIAQGPKNVSPNDFANTVINCATGQVSIHFKLKGVSSTLVGSSALSYAMGFVSSGKADAVFVSGVEEYHPMVEHNYKGAPVPFTENSACLVVESLEKAKERGARTYAEILGVGVGTDSAQGKRIDRLDGNGPSRALHNLWRQVGSIPSEADIIWSSAPALAEVHGLEQEIIRSSLQVRKEIAWKTSFGETLGCNEILPAVLASILMTENGSDKQVGGRADVPVILMAHQPGGNWSATLLKKVEQ